MTASKPEVQGWRVTRLSGSGYGKARRIIDAEIYNADSQDFWAPGARERHSIEPLIRLTDHEAARAADKARIAELEAANAINMPGLLDDLDEALEEIALRGRQDDYGYQQLRAWYSKMRRVTRTVDAALSQQGKEGEA